MVEFVTEPPAIVSGSFHLTTLMMKVAASIAALISAPLLVGAMRSEVRWLIHVPAGSFKSRVIKFSALPAVREPSEASMKADALFGNFLP